MEHNAVIESNTSRLPHYANVSTTVRLRGKEVKIHGLCTGMVAVKTSFKAKKGFGELAKLNIVLDRHYTRYMPIWVWVIEHPEGTIVVDTGENTAVNALDQYLRAESWFLRFQFRNAAKFTVTEQDELPYQLQHINLTVPDIKLVVLTHLHLDHTDGLKFFPRQEVIVSDYEYRYAQNNMASTYPVWFNPNRVRYQANKIDIFNDAYPITAAEDLLYIPTPGHTRGHSSVLFRTDEYDIIFAGDSSYSQEQVITGQLAGVQVDYAKSRQTYNQLLAYAALRKSIYLPTHDEQAGQRLVEKTFLI
jgi:N-acyl homoserine lactone hydrolase